MHQTIYGRNFGLKKIQPLTNLHCGLFYSNYMTVHSTDVRNLLLLEGEGGGYINHKS